MTALMHWVLLLVALATLAAVVLSYHKLSGMIQQARRESVEQSDNLFTQMEALVGLYAELQLDHALPRSRGWAASPDLLQVVVGLLNERRPSLLLECSSGLSTLVLAAHCRRRGRGRVLSLEHDPLYAEKTRAMLRVHGLEPWAEVIDAPLVPLQIAGWTGSWYDLKALPTSIRADMLLVDGPPSSVSSLARYPALPMLVNRLAESAVVVLDDVIRADEIEMVARWHREFKHARAMQVPRCEKGCAVLTLAPVP